MQHHVKRIGRLARILCVAGLALAALPAAAAACPEQAGTPVFSAFGDQADYFAAPGGTFEGGLSGWTGGALVGENEPWRLGGVNGRQALRVGTATASSPAFCIGLEHPYFRYTAKPSHFGAVLRVYLRYQLGGGWTTILVGTLSGTGGWQVAPPSLLAFGGTLPLGGTTQAQLQFRSDSGSWLIDSVYVDPYRK